DDGRNPSCSFKDRAGCVVAAVAAERGEKVICGASTGNAASSMACMTASLPVRTIIFVPQTAPKAKIAQLLVFGAEVITVKGTYDDAFDLCVQASRYYGWYNRNTGYNPFTREGKKTCSFEICEQLGWKVPDKVFVSVGDANIISGLWKGFTDLTKLGLTGALPQLVGVQAQGSNAVTRAFEGDGKILAVSGDTVADSISVSMPRDGCAGLRALKETGGFPIVVSDSEILSAIPELAREASVFAEPAGAAAYAGLKKAHEKKMLEEGETVVIVVTGNGLKDIASAMKTVGEPYLIEPDMESLKKLVSEKLMK
ncbi:MAG: threonine synthase, partial [Elusimicrobiaceae bacterium]|nr:threonine synthase [Elusimicrobiaceae bacterium]